MQNPPNRVQRERALKLNIAITGRLLEQGRQHLDRRILVRQPVRGLRLARPEHPVLLHLHRQEPAVGRGDPAEAPPVQRVHRPRLRHLPGLRCSQVPVP